MSLGKILRVWWKTQARFGKLEPAEFELFTISPPLPVLSFRKLLIPLCYQENVFGIAYRGMIYQCRKLDEDGIHMWHIRYYGNGRVTGHYEMDYYTHTAEHNRSVDLRKLRFLETMKLSRILRKRG